MSNREIITKGNLPHWYMPGAAHFVTYRLIDTLPFDVSQRLRTEREAAVSRSTVAGESNELLKARAHKQFFAAYDDYLDHVSSVRWLKNSAVAEVIVGNLYHHHQVKYQLLEYCVMPNHVHVLFLPLSAGAGSVAPVADAASVRIQSIAKSESELDYHSDEVADAKSPLSKIMHSLKSYTANEANKLLSREGPFWQYESYDHWVRNEAELIRIVEYIGNNPVKAKLVTNAWVWPYCSTYDRRHPREKQLARWR